MARWARKRRLCNVASFVLFAAVFRFLACRSFVSRRSSVNAYTFTSTTGASKIADSRQPPAAVLRGGASDERIQQLKALVAEVKARGDPRFVGQRRNFGEHTGRATGHEVTYLHEHVEATLLDWLWHCALDAADSLSSWDLSRYNVGRRRPSLRCLEAIDYFHEADGQPAAKLDAASDLEELNSALGWHHDGATICTMAVALSTAGDDFEGGELQIRDRGVRHTLSDLRRGDIAAWRGWDLHRVCPVKSGRRQVVVCEWWLGPRCSELDPRPADFEEVVQETLQVDTSSAQLHVLLGEAMAGKGDLAGALNELHTAVKLNEHLVEAQHALGTLLAESGHLAAAEYRFRTTLQLDPRQPKVYYNLAKCLTELGDVTGAEECLQAAIRLDPLAPELYRALTWVLHLKGDAVGSEESYKTYVRLADASQVGWSTS